MTDNENAEGLASDSEAQIQELLDEGAKAFALKDYSVSVQKYGNACELLDKKYGELSSMSGDAYFLYGRALLNYAIQQNSVLGGTVDQGEDEDQEKATIQSNPRFHFEGEPNLSEDVDNTEDSEQPQNDQSDGQPTIASSSSAEAKAEDTDDDFSYAWDILDIARVIYAKQDTPQARLKLAEVYLSLGDVSLETEKFDQAVSDFDAALNIKIEMLSADDRQLAEVHYKLALALEYSTQEGSYAKAEEHIKSAIAVLQMRLDRLVGLQTGKGKGKATESVSGSNKDLTNDEKEIEELREFIPDMEAKIEDLRMAEATKNQQADMLREVLAVQMNGDSATSESSSAPVTSSGPVNDLTTLVRSKKRPEPEQEQMEVDTKDAEDESVGETGKKRKVEIEEIEDEDT